MDAAPSATSVVEHEIRVTARPETVFAYFTDPGRMVKWMGADATLDPRPGGVCRIAFRPTQSLVAILDPTFGPEHQAKVAADPDAPRVMSGEFVEVDPPRRIAFTWGWERELYAVPPQSTAVEVSFTPDGDETIVRLTHRRLPPAAVPLHQGGWDHYLPRLGIAAEGRDPGPDPWQAGA